MTLIKSLLLGSAAGVVAVASAQAADLPTKKGAPAAEYVKICTINVGGTPIVGFTLPGSDTCLKISGYDSAQYTVASHASPGQDAFGMFNRAQLNVDAVSNTAAGPLLAHLEFQADYGRGFDSEYGYTGEVPPYARTQANSAFITWAGLTAGKHGSFFDYFAGGPAWDDFISPDHSGGPVPLIAYTVSVGGGFAATLSLEAPEGGAGPEGAGTEGWRAPDIVGQLKLTQAWGNVQLAGVGHYANDVPAIGVVGPSDRTWGYGVLGGITFNIPNYAGADIKLQGVYTHDAIGYSGLGSPGNFNYGPQLGYPTGTSSGVLGILADHILNGAGTGYDDSDAYSVAGAIDIPVSATFKVTPEASYGAVTYGNSDAVKADAFVGGGVLEWVPVKNLVFDLDLLYINGSYTEYTAFPVSAKQNYDGFNAKLRIERDF
jgi:hypothetical protein